MMFAKSSYLVSLIAVFLFAGQAPVNTQPASPHPSQLLHHQSNILKIAGKEIAFQIVPGSNEAMKFLDRDGRLLHTVLAEPGDEFEAPVAFRYNKENFIYVMTAPTGSGGFLTEKILWVAPDDSMHPVFFKQAAHEYENWVNHGEVVLTGGPGITFLRGRLTFEFFIASPDDPHCCPTAGRVTGTYKLVGMKEYDPNLKEYRCTYRLVADQFNREKIIPNQMASY